jgi:hypothetical protein
MLSVMDTRATLFRPRMANDPKATLALRDQRSRVWTTTSLKRLCVASSRSCRNTGRLPMESVPGQALDQC